MASQLFTHSALLMLNLHQCSFVTPTSKKNLANVTASPSISLCSLGRAIHEYEDIQQ